MSEFALYGDVPVINNRCKKVVQNLRILLTELDELTLSPLMDEVGSSAIRIDHGVIEIWALTAGSMSSSLRSFIERLQLLSRRFVSERKKYDEEFPPLRRVVPTPVTPEEDPHGSSVFRGAADVQGLPDEGQAPPGVDEVPVPATPAMTMDLP